MLGLKNTASDGIETQPLGPREGFAHHCDPKATPIASPKTFQVEIIGSPKDHNDVSDQRHPLTRNIVQH